MFLWNMVGALILIPALSHFLLNPVPAVIYGSQSHPSQLAPAAAG
jgi:hypothetical protein